MNEITLLAHKTNFGVQRDVSLIRWIVVHCTQGVSAKSSAMWFSQDHHNPKLVGSTHLVVDNLPEVYRCVPDDYVAYGAQESNRIGVHLEFSGFAEFTEYQWNMRDRELGTGADLMAAWALKYKIPAAHLSHDEMWSPTSRGIVTHKDVTDVFHAGKGHVDPGPHFPLDGLIEGVARRLSLAAP